MKAIFSLMLAITFGAIASEQPQKVGFPAQLATGEDGCSQEIAKKAKNSNRIVGAVAGAGAVAVSTISFPFSWVFLLGGLGAAGDIALDLGHEKFEDGYTKYIDKKKYAEAAPRVRYPIARKYYDLLNSVELVKVMERNKEDSMLTESIKIYIHNSYLMSTMKKQYKYCKRSAQKEGLSKDELTLVEMNLMDYSDLILNPDENKLPESSAKPFSVEALAKAKEDYATCIMNLADANGNYPVFETLLAKSELQQTNLLSWRMKGVLRLYMKAMEEAEKRNVSLTIDQYLNAISMLDKDKTLCTPKVKKQKDVLKLILE